MGYLRFTFVTENSYNVVFFLNHHLKSAFSKHGCNKTSMFMDIIPLPVIIMRSTMSTSQETVYRNDSVLFSLHSSCFTNINYDLKVCFTTNFSLTNPSGQNLFCYGT